MNIALKKADLKGYASALVVFSFTQEQIEALKKEKNHDALNTLILHLVQSGDFSAKEGQVLIHNTNHQLTFARFCLLGLGEKEKLTIQKVRAAYANVLQACRKMRISEYTISVEHMPDEKFSVEELAEAVIEVTLLADYEWDKYKTKTKESAPHISSVTFVSSSEKTIGSMREILHKTQLICEQVVFVRDCVNENADDMTPQILERLAKEAAKQYKLKLTVLDEHHLRKLGMGMILGVGQGSRYPPRMIFLEYHGNSKSKDSVAFVGKGITFDTGGLNLKPTGFIETMKCDMSGAAAVLGIIKAAAALKLPVNIVSVLSCAENALGSRAQKPGDVVKACNGKTVEITNTDAEGRLVLGDAMAYTVKQYKPKALIDIATLTGSCAMTFGDICAGIMGTDDKLIKSE